MSTATDDTTEIAKNFHDLVNMSAGELEKWLSTDESRETGQRKSEGGEAIGHKSGRAIVELLHHRGKTFTDSQIEQMKRTVSYVKRHLAQRPKSEDLEHTRWAASLKNWGHDPLK